MQVAASYLKICNELNTAPLQEFLSCLSAGLRACYLHSTGGTWPDAQLVALCAILPLSELTEMSFHGLQLSPKSWAPLAEACSKAKALRKLTIKDCNLHDGPSVASIARALGSSSLHVLDVSNCKLGDDFIAALVETALLRNDKLYVLRLVNCGITCDGACRLARAMEAIGMMTSLKVLDLGCNHIADRGACALAAMLIGATSSVPLQTLELEGNMVGDVGGLALSKAAKAALVLGRLNLSSNLLTDATIMALADALRFNTGTLKEVALAGSRGSQEAAVALLRAATKNNGLTLLDMRGIALGPEAVDVLCQMLRYTASLQTLRCDVASRQGAEQVVQELPSNRSLLQLTLGGPVPEALLTQLAATLAANLARGGAATALGRLPPTFEAWIDDATVAGPPAHRRSTSPHSPRSSISGFTSLRSRTTHNNGGHHNNASNGGGQHNTAHSVCSTRRSIGNSPLRATSFSETTAAGGARDKAAIMFRKHDLNQDNFLDRQEMLQALQEVGVLTGIRANKVGQFLDAQFKTADYDRDGKVSMNDFCTYYEKIAHYQTRMAREGRIKSHSNKSVMPAGTENNNALKKLFKGYSKSALGQGHQYGNDGVPHMNLQQFVRLCTDAGFVEPQGRLATTTLEVIFYRTRVQGQRRLGYKEFLDALAVLAYEGSLSFDDVLSAMGCRGPSAMPLLPPGTSGSTSGRPSESGSTAVTPRASLTSGGGAPVMSHAFIPTAPIAALIRMQEAGTLNQRMSLTSVRSSGGGASVRSSSGVARISNPLYDSVDASTFSGLTATTFRVKEVGGSPTPAAHAHAAGGGGNGGGFDGGRRDLAADGSRRDLADRVAHLEAMLESAVVKPNELRAVVQQVHSLQQQVQRLADEMATVKLNVQSGDGGAAVAFARQVDTLAVKLNTLSTDVTAMVTTPRADPAVGAAVERRLMDRQARLEGALMQVARQVDVLDTKLKDEQDVLRGALEAGALGGRSS